MSFLLWLAASSMTQICCFITKRWKKLIGPCWKLTLSYCSGRFFSPSAFRLLTNSSKNFSLNADAFLFPSQNGFRSVRCSCMADWRTWGQRSPSLQWQMHLKISFMSSLLFSKQTQKPTVFLPRHHSVLLHFQESFQWKKAVLSFQITRRVCVRVVNTCPN